jgi:hypothetical protein
VVSAPGGFPVFQMEKQMEHKAVVTTIDPRTARSMLELNFSLQRSVSAHHVQFLRDTMKAGEFDGGEPIRFGMSPNTPWVLLNGQHRLHAIASGETTVDMVVVYTKCQSAEDVARVYARIDRGRQRNMVDAMKALGLIARDNQMSQTDLKVFSQAAVLLRIGLQSKSISGNSYDSKSAEARHAEMEKWQKPAREYFAAIHGSAEKTLFERREVAAIGIVTFADAPHNAQAFWHEAAKDDGLRANDPRKKMLEVLRRAPVSRSGIGYLANAVASCWNAYIEGRDLSKVIVRDPRADITLLDTRYAKR